MNEDVNYIDKMLKNKLMIVLGSGGHTSQMLKLVDMLGKKFEYEYVIAEEDKLSEDKIKIKGEIHRMKRTREIGDGLFVAIIKQFIGCFSAYRIVASSDCKVIISCGPHIAIPISFVGKLLGKKIVFIESWSRIYKKSLSGKFIYKFADLFFVQWLEMKKVYPNAIYAGRFQ